MKVIEGKAVSRLPTPRVGQLSSLAGVRIELVKIYRSARRGELDTQDMTRLAYVLGQIAKVIETGDLEKRLERLEQGLSDAVSGKN